MTTVVAVVLVVVAIVILLSVFSGGGDDGDSSSATSSTTSTTRPRPSSTTLPRPPSAVDPILADGERLDPAFGLALVSIRSNGTVVVAELATGEEVVLDERVPVAPVQLASWIGSTFIARSVSDELHRLVPGTTNDWELVDTGGLTVDPYWMGYPGLVHAWDPHDSNHNTMRFGIVGATGDLQIFVPALTAVGTPVGEVEGEVVLNSPDGIYLIHSDGRARRHAHGFVLGVGHGRLVRHSCDEVLQCRLYLDEPATGTAIDLGPVDPTAKIIRAVPSPDGEAVAMLIGTTSEEMLLLVQPAPTGPTLRWQISPRWNEPYMLQWSSDGDGLAWIDYENRQIKAVRWRGEPSPEPATAFMARVPGPAFEANFLLPVESLPPGWSPRSGE